MNVATAGVVDSSDERPWYQRVGEGLLVWGTTSHWFMALVMVTITGSSIMLCSDADPDLFARLAVGRLREGIGYIPRQDPFAFTERYPTWFDHEWGSGVLFYWVYSWFGEAGLRGLAALCGIVTISLVYRLIRGSKVAMMPAAAGVLVFLLFCEIGFVWGSIVRSQVVTYLLYAYLLLAIQRWEQGSIRWMVCMPGLFVLWGACHGGVIAGEVVLALWGGERLMRRILAGGSGPGVDQEQEPLLLALVLVLSVGALFINPYGPSFVLFLLYATRMNRANIGEWAPRSLLAVDALPLLLGMCLTVISLPRFLRTRQWACGSILLLTAYKAVLHTRLSPLFMIPAYVWCLPEITSLWNYVKLTADRQFVLARAATGAMTIVAIVGLTRLLSGGFSALERLSYAGYPVDAIDWIAANAKGERLLVDFNSGSYALWRLYPETLVSLDGRYEELYPEKTVTDVSTALTTLDPLLVAKLNPSLILLPSTTWDSLATIEISAQYQELFRGKQFSVLRYSSGFAVPRHEQ